LRDHYTNGSGAGNPEQEICEVTFRFSYRSVTRQFDSKRYHLSWIERIAMSRRL